MKLSNQSNAAAVFMQVLDEHDATRPQRPHQSIPKRRERNIGENNQVPLIDAKVEPFCIGHQRVYGYSRGCRRLFRQPHPDIREIKSGDLPTLPRKPDRIAALSHADVQRSPRLPGSKRVHHERVRLVIKSLLFLTFA